MYTTRVVPKAIAQVVALPTMLCFVLMLAGSLEASSGSSPLGTDVGGPIISDTTWTLSGSPYRVVENIDVWIGVTLVIEPGVKIRFEANKGMEINGELIAQGTATKPIIFTSNQALAHPGDWSDIVFTDTSSDAEFDAQGNYEAGSVLQYCDVSYGGGQFLDGTIVTDDASPFINHCAIHHNSTTGIYADGTAAAPILIQENAIFQNSRVYSHQALAVFVSDGRVLNNVVENNVLEDSYFDVIYATYSTISGNTVRGNTTGVTALTSTVTENQIYNNESVGLTIIQGVALENMIVGNKDGGVLCLYGTLASNLITDNVITGFYRNGAGINANGCEISENIVARNILTGWSPKGGGIYMNGGTAMRNTVVGNIVVGHNVQGSGMYLESVVSASGNVVIGNIGQEDAQAPVGAFSIYDYGDTDIHFNAIYGNLPYDALVVGSYDIDGRNNFWGTVESVDILAQIWDWHDDSSLGKLLYIPYLQNPSPDAPVPPPLNLTGSYSRSQIELSWDAVPSTTTGYGYKLYYDTDGQEPPYEGSGLIQGDSPINVGNLTEFVLDGLDPNKLYFVAVTAYDTHGRESWYSNVIVRGGRVYLPLLLATRM